MRLLALAVLVVACSGSPPSAPLAGSADTGCHIAGRYRLRYSSNGTDGWWLRFRVTAAGAAELTGEAAVLGLDPGPIEAAIDPAACKLTLSATTRRAGRLRIELAVDPSGSVTGTVARTEPADEAKAPRPIAGRHETSRPELPPCLHPGVFELVAQGTWTLSDGHPTPPYFGCQETADSVARARVRIESVGSELVVDEAEEPPRYEQGFGRGKATRTGDCTFTLSFERQLFKFDGAKLTFDGDNLTGVAATGYYEFYESEMTGENHWTCTARQLKIAGKRVAPDLL